jgi:dTDP-4-dehydrorhamnose 3,5-epimerase
MSFEFKRLEIQEVILIKPKVFVDERGFFLETYKHSDFAAAGISEHFVQDNHSRSTKGVLRGLHYQTDPRAQGKLVFCIKGEIFDVAVDIRKGSPSYGKWVSVKLTGEDKICYLYHPALHMGFACFLKQMRLYINAQMNMCQGTTVG